MMNGEFRVILKSERYSHEEEKVSEDDDDDKSFHVFALSSRNSFL